MILPIFWTKEALETFDLVVEQIHIKWNEKETGKFIYKTQNLLNFISKQPYIFKASEIGNSVRKAVLSKQTSLFYRVEDKQIVLLYFWDNRQETMFL